MRAYVVQKNKKKKKRKEKDNEATLLFKRQKDREINLEEKILSNDKINLKNFQGIGIPASNFNVAPYRETNILPPPYYWGYKRVAKENKHR